MRDLIANHLEPIPVLDHGFVRLVDSMPRMVDEDETGDHAIAAAARVSYQKGTKTSRSDRGLIRYLMRHRHTSPFEMVDLKFHVKMPIFVARQWVRHRTASINEVSARYSILPEEAYTPTHEALRPQSTDNKQGRAAEGYDTATSSALLETFEEAHSASFESYDKLLEANVARETARGVMNVSTYTEWYWKANLLNTMRFVQLRIDPHAQYEIRVFAEAIASIIEHVAPWTYEAFNDYWVDSVNLSGPQWAALQGILSDDQRQAWEQKVKETTSAGEAREFSALFKRDAE